jgi:hypothetical protein
MPLLVQLEAKLDRLEFWKQTEALGILQGQMLAAISDVVPASSPAIEVPLPPREAPKQKTSFFSRKPSKAPEATTGQIIARAPVDVGVQLEEVYFRLENEYGLMQTVGAKGVILSVEVR